MTQMEMKKNYEMFGDAWRFFKQYAANPNDSDDFWEQLTEAADRLDKRYESRLFRDILVATVAEINFLARNPGKPRPIGKPLPGEQV